MATDSPDTFTNDETPDELPGAPSAPGMVPLSAVEALGRSIGEAIGKSQRRKQPFGEYDPKSSYHPDKTKTPKLRRVCFQNGYHMNPKTLKDEEIRLLNRITHSGRYYDRLVEVRVDDSGAEEVVYISYNNKTVDQRMALKDKFRSLQELLQHVVEIQETEDLELAERETQKRTTKRR